MPSTKVVKLEEPGSFKVYIGLKQYRRTMTATGPRHQLVVVPVEEERCVTFRNVGNQPLRDKIEKLVQECCV
ncbi:MAG: hypothetical protein ACRCTP_04040 [Aeromonas popoffii]|uniref:hypothetical protein n=1 Tax=Aeromonas popoffii TaxID=70856 RepID=UPI003F332470